MEKGGSRNEKEENHVGFRYDRVWLNIYCY